MVEKRRDLHHPPTPGVAGLLKVRMPPSADQQSAPWNSQRGLVAAVPSALQRRATASFTVGEEGVRLARNSKRSIFGAYV